MLNNTEPWSARDFLSENRPECCYITLDPDQQATLYQKSRDNVLLYNTGSWAAGDFIP